MKKPLAVRFLESYKKFHEGRKSEGDEIAARELALYIENDGNLYRGSTTPAIENLAKKVVKGNFDKDKSVMLWKYTADAGAKKYQKEFGDTFTAETRRMTAKMLADYYEEEIMYRAKEIEGSKKK